MNILRPTHIIFLLLVTIISVTVLPTYAQEPHPNPTSPEFVPGEVVIKFKPQVGQLSGKRTLQKEGARIVKTSPNSGLLRVEVTPGYEQETINNLMARGDVEFATLNYIVHTMGEPNDIYYRYNYQWGLNKIQAPNAWDISTGAETMTIAVIDSGVDLDHPDLAAKLWVNSDEITGNGIDDDGNGYVDDRNGYDFYNNDSTPDDDNSHGSHVAGIAAAATNNNIGVAGVSWGAKIMPLKALNSSGVGGTSDVAEAVYYAVNNGAQVINMSLGSRYSEWPCGWRDIEDAFNYAVSNNVLIVAASGNDSQYGVNCPGAYDQTMAVGATTSSDSRAGYSNYGPRLDIAAPGDAIYSTVLRGGYSYKSGTSMATPYVAGLAALVWGLNPAQTATEVRQIIETTADDLGSSGWDSYYGHGRVNAYSALTILTLTDSSGLEISGPLAFIADDETGPLPVAKTIQVNTLHPDVVTWTASISPSVSWVNISPAASGFVTASSSAEFTLTTIRPDNYGSYSANLVVAGTTSTEYNLKPVTTEISMNFVEELKQYYFPVIPK